MQHVSKCFDLMLIQAGNLVLPARAFCSTIRDGQFWVIHQRVCGSGGEGRAYRCWLDMRERLRMMARSASDTL